MEFERKVNQTVRCRMMEFRKKYLQISVEEFSQQTGIKVSRVKNIEAGKGKIKLSEMTAVMDAYFLSSEYLLGQVDRPKPIIMKVWESIEQLSPEERHKLYGVMKKKQEGMGICSDDE